jgi:putative hydrolase of the HAD superfamily
MSHNIKAIFLDTGNTMRIVETDAAFQYRARQQLVKLIGTQESPDAFGELLSKRYEAYKKWAKDTQIQAPEQELWTRWMLPDFPTEQIKPLAGKLTRLWIDQGGRRVPRPDVKQTVKELKKRGYTLGIIANSLSETEIPEWLERDGLAQYFSAVVLSAKLGYRKPKPEIYVEAARLVGVEPARCSYVGDNPSRDILGARMAGFGMVIILLEAATLQKEPPKGKFKPDGIIRECMDLLNFFPPRDDHPGE